MRRSSTAPTPAPPRPPPHTKTQASLGELKSFGSPAVEVVNVVAACMVLTAPNGKVPKDCSWAAGKKVRACCDAKRFVFWGGWNLGAPGASVQWFPCLLCWKPS